MTAAPDRLAKRISAWALPRTCVTVPGAEFDRVGPHGLDRVDNRQPRRFAVPERRDDVLDAGLGRELDRRVGQAQPICPQTHLRDRLFAGNVDGAFACTRERRGSLDEERRFTDARIAADQ